RPGRTPSKRTVRPSSRSRRSARPTVALEAPTSAASSASVRAGPARATVTRLPTLVRARRSGPAARSVSATVTAPLGSKRRRRPTGAPAVRRRELPGVPERGDVSDWLQAGLTADELRALADAAPARNASATGDDPGAPGKTSGRAAPSGHDSGARADGTPTHTAQAPDDDPNAPG